MIRGLIWAAAVLGLDQGSKWWVFTRLTVPPEGLDVTPFFTVVRVYNPGISFSLFASGHAWMPWILSTVATVVVAWLFRWLYRTPQTHRRVQIALGLVIGGAIGNVVDRIRLGAVADFLDFHVAGWHWPAFNVADSAVTVGALLLFLDALFPPPRSQ